MTIRTVHAARRPGSAPSGRAARRALGVATALLAGAASGQVLENQVGIPVGDATLYPSLRVGYEHDSNVGLRAEDEVEGDAVVVSPRLDYVAERRRLRLALGYLGAFSASDDSALEYGDHRLSAAVAAEFDSRRRASAELAVARDHEELGFDLTRGLGDAFDEPLKYNTVGLGAQFVYGAVDARGNLVAGLDLETRSYTNLASLTDGRDYTLVEPYGAFGYRLSSDTRAIAELRFSSAAFDDAGEDRDEVSVLGGMDFTATGKLRGGFRLGASRASFAAEGVDDETALVARANVDWLPREYAVLSLALDREFDNTTSTRVGQDQSILTVARLGWNHRWSSRFVTDAFAQLYDVARACPDNATATVSAGAEFGLAVRRWLQVGAGARQAMRSADDCPDGGDGDGLDYDRTLYNVYVRATL